MENIVNLEQLDYRDQLIKKYIDQHSGGGSSNYVPITVSVKRMLDDEYGDTQKVYIGVPSNTNIEDLEPVYVRYSKTRDRDKEKQIQQEWNKASHKEWHQVWKLPVSNKEPLITLVFKDKDNCDYSNNGWDFYEVYWYYNDAEYPMTDLVNNYDPTGYKKIQDESLEDVTIHDILKCRTNGIRLYRNGDPVSNPIKFFIVYSGYIGEYRIKAWE